ncbi:helix-turn-helix domain-containing protein [Catenulispora yoronensis]|uniref:Helix-turn-helix domain-containing protein n=1 Tax=Catenulispora yoronensis TaxID=450799 RepID=A0ABN2UNQ5_9ACTN
MFGLERGGIPRRYDFAVCTEAPGEVQTSGGYSIYVVHGLEALETADTIIIPGWAPVDAPLPDPIRRALLRAHGRGARLVTICSGVFALARTGLLDGRSATAHWKRADQLRREFPALTVEPHRRYIDHGDIATSAGAGAGIDLCLHLVQRDHGAEHAALVAQHMTLPPYRASEARQQLSAATPPAEALDVLLTWATERLSSPLTVSDLAGRLGVSSRTLARRFADNLGIGPGEWLLARRVAEARTLLEQTDLPVEAIAVRVGLSSAVNLRRRFRDQVGTTPGAYRQAFRAGAACSAGPARLASRAEPAGRAHPAMFATSAIAVSSCASPTK